MIRLPYYLLIVYGAFSGFAFDAWIDSLFAKKSAGILISLTLDQLSDIKTTDI